MIAIFRLIRIKNLFIVALLQTLIRYGLIIPILHAYGYESDLSDMRFIILVLSTVLLAASGYVINDYFDIKIDRLNRPDKMVLENDLKRRDAMFLHVILTFTGVFMGMYISYVFRKEAYALMYIVIPAVLWYYSTTFKKHGLIGNIMVSGLIALVAILVVSVEFTALNRVHGSKIIESEVCNVAWFWTLGFAFFAFVVNLIREIVKDCEDVLGDKEQGCHTLPIDLGFGYTKTIVTLLISFVVIVIWLLYFSIDRIHNSQISLWYIIGFITIPFAAVTYLMHKANTPEQYHKVSTILKLIMLAGVLFIFVVGNLF